MVRKKHMLLFRPWQSLSVWQLWMAATTTSFTGFPQVSIISTESLATHLSSGFRNSPKQLPLLEVNIEQQMETTWPLCMVLETEMGDDYRVQGRPLVHLPPLPIEQPALVSEIETTAAKHGNNIIGSDSVVSPREIEEEPDASDPSRSKGKHDNGKALLDPRKSVRVIKSKVSNTDQGGVVPALPHKAGRKKWSCPKDKKAIKSATTMPSIQIFGPGSVHYNPIDIDKLDVSRTMSTHPYAYNN